MLNVEVTLNEKQSPTFEIPGVVFLNALAEPPVLSQQLSLKEDDAAPMTFLLHGLKAKRITVKDKKALEAAYAKCLGAADDEPVKTLKDSFIIGLGRNQVVWATSDGLIRLSRFDNITWIKLEKKSAPTKAQIREINMGLTTGVLELLDEEPKESVPAKGKKTKNNQLQQADSDLDEQLDRDNKMMRLILDSGLSELAEMVKTLKPNDLALLYKVEKAERARPEYLELIGRDLPAVER